MKERVSYGISTTLDTTYEDAIQRVTEALKGEGFGVLTTIDVKGALKEKIGVDFKDYVIIGACNPHLAHEALTKEEDIGLLLPCNVIVYKENDKIVVSAIDPKKALSIVDNDELKGLAGKVHEKLENVIKSLT